MSAPKTYRKKPVEIQAVQWWKDGDHDQVGLYRYPPVDPVTGEISAAADAILLGQVQHCATPEKFRRSSCTALMHDHGWIDTLEGGHTVCPGDWIIRGVKGEFYPCKPDIFAATYEEVVPDDRPWMQDRSAADNDTDPLAEARGWARHGYEIGQRSCTWSDQGVAPKWLTMPESARP